jgi:hypothetical protein
MRETAKTSALARFVVGWSAREREKKKEEWEEHERKKITGPLNCLALTRPGKDPFICARERAVSTSIRLLKQAETKGTRGKKGEVPTDHAEEDSGDDGQNNKKINLLNNRSRRAVDSRVRPVRGACND